MREYRREVTVNDLILYILITLVIIFALFAIGTSASMKPQFDTFMSDHQKTLVELDAMNRGHEGTEVTK